MLGEVQFLSRGFVCGVSLCSHFTTHEESLDANLWVMRCDLHCECDWTTLTDAQKRAK